MHCSDHVVHTEMIVVEVLCKLVKWNEDTVNKQLPLLAGTCADMSVTVFGLSDFMSSNHRPAHTGTYLTGMALFIACSVTCHLLSGYISQFVQHGKSKCEFSGKFIYTENFGANDMIVMTSVVFCIFNS